MAADVEQGHPRGGLLDHLGHRVVIEQVGQSHFGIADAVAEGQIARDVEAGGLRGSAAADAPIREERVASAGAADDAQRRGAVAMTPSDEKAQQQYKWKTITPPTSHHANDANRRTRRLPDNKCTELRKEKQHPTFNC